MDFQKKKIIKECVKNKDKAKIHKDLKDQLAVKKNQALICQCITHMQTHTQTVGGFVPD